MVFYRLALCFFDFTLHTWAVWECRSGLVERKTELASANSTGRWGVRKHAVPDDPEVPSHRESGKWPRCETLARGSRKSWNLRIPELRSPPEKNYRLSLRSDCPKMQIRSPSRRGKDVESKGLGNRGTVKILSDVYIFIIQEFQILIWCGSTLKILKM